MSPKLFKELTDQHGIIVIMYPNDHPPAHVHVYRGEKVTRISFEPNQLAVMDARGYGWLEEADEAAQRNIELLPDAVYWPDLGEGLEVEGMLRGIRPYADAAAD